MELRVGRGSATANRLSDERGFTFMELMIVMVIIGILAGIAMTMLKGNRTNAVDSEAKQNAGSMMAHVESCFTETEDYGQCETGDPLLGDTKMAEGAGPGQTRVMSDGPHDYVIESVSRSGNTFRLVKVQALKPTRSCTVKPGGEGGGCNNSAW
jgi:type IV pilus assembly protein PilA